MKMRMGIALICAAVVVVVGADRASSAVITQWTFPTTAASSNSPAPNVGSGTATVLGMTFPETPTNSSNPFVYSSGNTITGTGTFIPGTILAYGSVPAADILATPGAPSGDANAWRVRGPSNNAGGADGMLHGGNGWNLAAPQYSQGAQFSASTTGFTNIAFHADWFTTTQGVKNLQPQYTLNGTTWINFGSLLTAVSNGFETIDLNFASIPGAANDPNFGVRLVSAYDPTLAIPNYGSADGGQAGVYNNNSGNWRFTDVTFSGTAAAVPEPTSLLLCGLAGGLGLLYKRRRTGQRVSPNEIR